MSGFKGYVRAASVLAGLLAGSAFAELKEVGEGVFVEDFKDGTVRQLESGGGIRPPKVVEIVTDGGKPALHVQGAMQSVAYYRDRKFKDFTLEVDMKKTKGSYAGVVVRDHWRVYFQMKGFLCLNARAGLKGVRRGELWKSSETFRGYHKLKIVCAGPILHVYIDGKSMFKHKITADEGRVGYYSHNGEAFYRGFRVDTRVNPLEALSVEPRAPDDTLVFSPGRNLRLSFEVSNHSDTEQQVSVAASVKTWDDAVVARERRQKVRVPAGRTSTAEFDAGRIPAGFYRIEFTADCGGTRIAGKDDVPLAVHDRWTGEFKAPLIPIAPYSKYMCEKSPLYLHTYAHAIARSLRDHNLTGITACPMMFGDRKVFDIFHSYGIAVITRSGGFINHPAVIGALVYDEPKMEEIEKLKGQYEKLRTHTSKPFTTCMVGERTGLGGTVPKWERLLPSQGEQGLRAFRWYGVKKHFYDALFDLKYKGNLLPLPDLLRVVEASHDSPYWFIPPSFGPTDHEAYFQNPSPAQFRCMMHLAMAYGADGLLPFCLQPLRDGRSAFIEQKSLKPCDGKYAAAAEVAAQINANARLLTSLKHGGLDVRCRSPYVEVVPRTDAGGKLYVYVVNLNAKAPADTRLLVWAGTWNMRRVTSVYGGRSLKIERDAEGYLSVPLSLEAGDGDLLVTDAERR